MSSKKTASFINRNIIAIVIIPTIFALHWACNSIQNNEKFVKQHERKDLPIIMAMKYAKNQTIQKYEEYFGKSKE